MKCAIVFVALFAVSQAAFTSRLSQQAQPILSDAVAKMRVVSRSSMNFREIDVATGLVESLQNHADDLMEQITNALTHGQTVANTVVQQLQATQAQLAALGSSVHGSASGILQSFLNGFGNIFGNLFGGLGKAGSVTDHLTNLIQSFGLENHVTNVLSHSYVQAVAQLIENLGFGSMVQNVISTMLPTEIANYVLAHFNDAGKGLFDGISHIAGQISAASQALAASLTTTLQQFASVASSNFQQLQVLATQFAAESMAQAQTTVHTAAQSFLDFLKPYQADLGNLYNDVVAQVGALVNQF